MSSACGNMGISAEASRMLTTKVEFSCSQSGNSASIEQLRLTHCIIVIDHLLFALCNY
jgi:hypothetical protein